MHLQSLPPADKMKWFGEVQLRQSNLLDTQIETQIPSHLCSSLINQTIRALAPRTVHNVKGKYEDKDKDKYKGKDKDEIPTHPCRSLINQTIRALDLKRPSHCIIL